MIGGLVIGAVLIAGAGSAAFALPAQEAPPSLVEAARRNRARIVASRGRNGPAPRFTDADLAAGHRRAVAVAEPAAPADDEDHPALGPEPWTAASGEDALEAGADDLRAAMDARLREIAAREAEIRERLLEIEVSLTAIGVSGLPYAQRNPNRFQSPFDAGRLRAERRELRLERDALTAERRLLR